MYFYLLDLALWTGAIGIVGASVALSVVSAKIQLPVLGAITAIPVAIGLLAFSLGLDGTPPHPAYAAVIAIELFVLGITAGSPLTIFTLGLSEARTVRVGVHGGIVEGIPTDNTVIGRPIEILRGGATIGYLERLAVLGCLIAGRVEGIAVIVAIKGLGRFSELSSPEARERFIIGTLVSLIWAGATGALLLLVLQ